LIPSQGAAPVTAHAAVTPKVQTIELTGKHWKVMMLLGALSNVAGCATCAAGKVEFSVLCWAIGLVLVLGSKIGTWWHHG